MKETGRLTKLINEGMDFIFHRALNDSLKNPRELIFLLGHQLRFHRAKKIRSHYEEKGRHIPGYLIASVTTRCNLSCAGCYARANAACGAGGEKTQLSDDEWDGIFAQAKALGISFILLAGGEPLLRREILARAGRHREIIFPVFTNGTMLDRDYVALFDRNRNLVPILSLEGNRTETDERRGAGIYDLLTRAMELLSERRVLFGVSITVTTENLKAVTEDGFLSDLSARGCTAVIFVEYVPVTQESRFLAPGPEEQEYLLGRTARLQQTHRHMIFLSFPGDEREMGGCLAAGRGFFHINASGGAEPCPFSPFSDVSLREKTLLDALDSPLFRRLERSGLFAGEHAGGCLLFEHRQEVEALLESGTSEAAVRRAE